MRRSDREVTELAELEQIIRSCDVCRLGLSENNIPYIVPMNFGYELDSHVLTLYFHSAAKGKKLDILKNNPNVCFELDFGHELVAKENACSYSMKYQSIIGNGVAEFITDMQEQNRALSKMMENYTGKSDFKFEQSMVRQLAIFKVTAQDFTGKAHR